MKTEDIAFLIVCVAILALVITIVPLLIMAIRYKCRHCGQKFPSIESRSLHQVVECRRAIEADREKHDAGWRRARTTK